MVVEILWQKLVEQLLAALLLFQIIRRPLFDQRLQIVGVLLHAAQQVVQNVAALIVPWKKQKNGSHHLDKVAHSIG